MVERSKREMDARWRGRNARMALIPPDLHKRLDCIIAAMKSVIIAVTREFLRNFGGSFRVRRKISLFRVEKRSEARTKAFIRGKSGVPVGEMKPAVEEERVA